jgi:hypothetical protein
MQAVRRSLLTCVGVALLGAALSAPAMAAGSGKFLFVQGIPGKKVDVCVGNTEIVSNLAYARTAHMAVSTGNKLIKFRNAAPGVCAGSVIASWTRAVAAGSETTVAITKYAPRVVVFPDTLTSTPPPPAGAARVYWRSASDVDGLGVRWVYTDGNPWTPTADPVYDKGVWGFGIASLDTSMLFWVHVYPDLKAVASPIQIIADAENYHEFIIVGTTLKNLRVVHLERDLP